MVDYDEHHKSSKSTMEGGRIVVIGKDFNRKRMHIGKRRKPPHGPNRQHKNTLI
jgi:hypothetical protein